MAMPMANNAGSGPRMCMPKMAAFMSNRSVCWTASMLNDGAHLPTMISTELAGLARSRSHVRQPCSRKNANATSPLKKNANITVRPGTACSAPLAPA